MAILLVRFAFCSGVLPWFSLLFGPYCSEIVPKSFSKAAILSPKDVTLLIRFPALEGKSF